MKLTSKQIERLVRHGELVHTECKDASGGLPNALWESYSSFANTDGGVILLGVKEVDHKLSIVGVPNAAKLIKQFWDGVNNREKVNENILFDRHVYSVKCRSRDVVVIEVPRADRRDRRRTSVHRIPFFQCYAMRATSRPIQLYWNRFPLPTLIRTRYDITVKNLLVSGLGLSGINCRTRNS